MKVNEIVVGLAITVLRLSEEYRHLKDLNRKGEKNYLTSSKGYLRRDNKMRFREAN